MGRGRPTTYKPEYCDLLVEHMANGSSFGTFACVVGCCRNTLYEWVRAYPQFSSAKDVGSARAYGWWERLGVGALQGKIPRFSSAVWILAMRNRFGWSHKGRTEGSPSGFANRAEPPGYISQTNDSQSVTGSQPEETAQEFDSFLSSSKSDSAVVLEPIDWPLLFRDSDLFEALKAASARLEKFDFSISPFEPVDLQQFDFTRDPGT